MEIQLKRIYAEHTFQSSGINADSEIPIPTDILLLLESWGLRTENDPDIRSRNFFRDYFDEDTIFIASDLEVFSEIKRINPNLKTLDLSQFALSSGVVLKDPRGMSGIEFRNMISSHIHFSNRLMQSALMKKKGGNIIEGFKINKFHKECELKEFFSQTLSRDAQVLFLDVTFNSYYENFFRFEPYFLKIKETLELDQSTELLNMKTKYVSLLSDDHHYERFWLSPSYLNFISSLSRQIQLVLLLPPYFETGSAPGNFYLASMYCEGLIEL